MRVNSTSFQKKRKVHLFYLKNKKKKERKKKLKKNAQTFQNTKSNFSSTEKNHLKMPSLWSSYFQFLKFFSNLWKKKVKSPAFYNTSDKTWSQFFRRDINFEVCKIPRLRFLHVGKNERAYLDEGTKPA